jgi:hypothetical protein
VARVEPPRGGHLQQLPHAISGAPTLKAQHPEFEMYMQGVHARSGVTCADCHMPYLRVGATKVSDHWVRSPLLNLDNACRSCHQFSEEELRNRAHAIQDRTYQLRNVAIDAVLDLTKAQPSFETGLGDDASTLQALVPVHYRFATGGAWRPYAGGGVVLSLIDYDDRPGRRDDDEDFDIAPVAVGGLERVRGRGGDLHLELQLGGGAAFDAKVVVGWTF